MKLSHEQQRFLGVTIFVNLLVSGIVIALALGFIPFPTSQSDHGIGQQQTSIKSITPLQDQYVSTEKLIVELVERVNPAVVSIVITKDVPVIEQYFEEYNPFGDRFDPFGFGDLGIQIPRQRQNGTERREIGGGSGFIVSQDGFVVTNKHVVDDTEAEYTVLTNEGESFPVEVIARDPQLDIAVLKITESGDYPYVSFGDSSALQAGQTAIAIGNALGEFRNSVSVGVISGLSRSILAGDGFGSSELLEEVIQTDAAINPGNSGGPLLNSQGQVIGVNVAVASRSENIGFALPANIVARIVQSVQENGEIIRPYIGVRYIPVTERLVEINNLDVDYGVLVQRGDTPEELAVLPGSPADRAGIEENDIILEINGEKIDGERSFASLIRDFGVGDTIRLTVLHDGEQKTLELVLGQAPSSL